MSTHDSRKLVRLLYIEDDKDISKLIFSYLTDNRHTDFIVEIKNTLGDALEYLNSTEIKPDVILLDLILPNSKGITTYEKLSEAANGIPIVITSGHEDIAIECVKRGAQDYIAKPIYGLDTITRSLRYAIERTKLLEDKINAEKGYNRVIKSSPLGIHIYKIEENGDLLLKNYNNSSDKILGFDHKTILNLKIEEAFPGLKDTEVPKIYKDIAKNGGKFCEIREYSDKKIKKSFYRMHVFQSAIDEVTVMFEDITKMILTERKFNHVVEAANAGIFEVDYRQNKFTYVNDTVCKLTEYSEEEILSIKLEDILTEDSIAKFHKKIEDLNNGEYIDKTIEYTIKTKSGNIKYILCTFDYIEDPITNQVIGATAIAIDVTEKKETEEKLRRQEDIIFGGLEKKLHQWRNELSLKQDAQNSLG